MELFISDLEDDRLPPLARELLVDQAEHLRAMRTGSLISTGGWSGRRVTTKPAGG